MTHPADVLIVDDDPALRAALADRLRFWGHAPAEAGTGAAALRATAEREFDIILLDLGLPDMSGMEVLRRLVEATCTADVIVLTAHGSIEAAVDAVKLGASDFLLKPADFELLRAATARVLERRRLERANRALEERVGRSGSPVLGGSDVMRDLLATAERAAAARSTVLLTGENGAGKQVVAEFIHRASPRRDRPMVYVSCVALTEDLMESTLFGHEQGAFTGATRRKPGLLETAAGGTAFLDEVGDVSPAVQAKLLHFLETGECMRVGSTRTLRIDCRIVAATNRPLETGVREGWFREDLYYRLNVITLRVPPLRERRADIRPLVEAFVARFAAEMKRGTLSVAPQTMELLEGCAWPGNVRQLRNVVERMVVLAPGTTLTPDLLPPEVLAPPDAPGGPPIRADRPYKEAVRDFKRWYVSQALARNDGNQTRAAEELELQRSFLNRLIKELNA